MDKLVLIDGNSVINRAFYATPPLTDSKGQPTNAVFGFMNMLIKIIGDLSPKYLIVAFDRKEPTFRHTMYTEYKGTRKPMPEDLRPQIPLLKEVLKVMGITIYDKAGFEADDIIGTLAKRYNGETIIITGDKDSFQLVDETTSIYFTRRGISDIDILSLENFKDKTGINPSQVIDLNGLMGDSSDNIPGIPGVGEKTAQNLIETYGSVEEIYNHLEDFKGKTLEKIVNGKDSAYLSKKLATIDTGVDIPIEIEKTSFEFPFNEATKRIFTELEFRGILKRKELFDASEEEILESKEIEIKEIKNKKEFDSLSVGSEVSISILNNISLYFGGEVEYQLKIKETFFDEGFEYDEALNLLKPIFEDETKTVILYSRKKTADLLFEYGIEILAKVEDVDIERYLVEFSGREESLEETLYYFNENVKTPAYSLYKLSARFLKEIKEQGMEGLYYSVELPLSKVLTDMERAGFKIDLTALDKVGSEYKEQINTLLEKIVELAGETFNVNSPKQLAYILFEKLGLKHGKKNKTGSYSTNAEALEDIEKEHPIIPLILRYRTVSKLYSTYIEGIKPLIDKKTSLVHTCFNQTLTQTGRLSSKEPNLQNIPVRDEEGKELRKLFIARSEDRVLIDADYSQIELRLLAHFSNSEELINAYKEERDIHSVTASQVFSVPLNEVTSTMRRNAKAVNFGIIYGISEYGLAKNLKISPKTASDYIKKYFEMYPKVKEYMNKNVEDCRKNGYVTTVLGRKRVIKEINSPNYNLRSFGERAAMNMPLQGSSADIIKIAMVNVHKRLKEECPNSKLILQVHDELIIDAPISESKKAEEILVKEMENAVQLSVPLTVEAHSGKSWFDAK
ncbi:MAG: DNA polymerase I [Clostridia bacterium]|nr:DNA polymerase I [Clostridia bacterium]